MLPIGLDVSTVPHEAHVGLTLGFLHEPFAQTHDEAAVLPTGLVASAGPHDVHGGLAEGSLK